ncbi:hypothetical protein JTB14_034026 [Gonioctena quinquepunctata]|nr:hypothetical protein JTB14_034026 [Gonioctena quinquepunctata]
MPIVTRELLNEVRTAADVAIKQLCKQESFIKSLVDSVSIGIEKILITKFGVLEAEMVKLKTDIQEMNGMIPSENNVLLFGIPEDVSSLKDFVLDAVSVIKPDLDVRGSQVIRLGRFSTDKSRPAKLTLPNKFDVPVLIKDSKHRKSTEKYKGI